MANVGSRNAIRKASTTSPVPKYPATTISLPAAISLTSAVITATVIMAENIRRLVVLLRHAGPLTTLCFSAVTPDFSDRQHCCPRQRFKRVGHVPHALRINCRRLNMPIRHVLRSGRVTEIARNPWTAESDVSGSRPKVRDGQILRHLRCEDSRRQIAERVPRPILFAMPSPVVSVPMQESAYSNSPGRGSLPGDRTPASRKRDPAIGDRQTCPEVAS